MVACFMEELILEVSSAITLLLQKTCGATSEVLTSNAETSEEDSTANNINEGT